MPTSSDGPKTATPAKHTIDSQNSHRSILKIRLTLRWTSNKPIADEITTAAKAAVGTFFQGPAPEQQQQGDHKRADHTG